MGDRAPIKPDFNLHLRRFRVPSTDVSSPRVYVVTLVEASNQGNVGKARVAVACTCPDFEFKVHACKHMRRVEASPEIFEEVCDE